MAAARSVEAVQRVLEEESVYIRVFSSTCRQALSRGVVDGVWPLGSLTGTCCGSLAWLTAEGHVVKVHGEGRLDSRRVHAAPALEQAPWT